jgi:hypothetical protein
VACDLAPAEQPAAAEKAGAQVKAEPKAKKAAKDPKPRPGPTPSKERQTPRGGSRAAPPHTAPKGTIGGKTFAPDTVLLLENSDGAKLVFSQREPKRERWRCEEPLGDTKLEVSLYRAIPDWVPSRAVEAELRDFGTSGFDSSESPAGTARIVLSKKDPGEFALAGSIELASSDGTWKLAGEFVGEYCPTKAVERETPAPLSGMPWGLGAVAADALPRDQLAAVIAGHPSPIAHVTVRDVERDGQRRTELVFFAESPPEPCAARPAGGGLTTYADDGSIASRDVAPFRIDSFRIELAGTLAAGDRLSGTYDGSDADARAQIADADLGVFEPDGYRRWKYWQYYSAARAVDQLTNQRRYARVYLALPDDGRSMLVGAFEAKRCPALP